MILVSKPSTSLIKISPILIGAFILVIAICFKASLSLSLGIGLSDLTGISGKNPFSTLIVVVRIRLGAINSSRAYTSPLLHECPSIINSPDTFSTCTRHPVGQMMHLMSLEPSGSSLSFGFDEIFHNLFI